MKCNKLTEHTGANDEISEWGSELNMNKVVMATTLHCDGEKSHHF